MTTPRAWLISAVNRRRYATTYSGEPQAETVTCDRGNDACAASAADPDAGNGKHHDPVGDHADEQRREDRSEISAAPALDPSAADHPCGDDLELEPVRGDLELAITEEAEVD